MNESKGALGKERRAFPRIGIESWARMCFPSPMHRRTPAGRRIALLFVAIALVSAIGRSSLVAAPFFESELIFPPERFHNHSPSVVETPQGNLLACWFHGQGERKDNSLVILAARKTKENAAWSKHFVLADNQGLPDQNPTLFIDPQQRLWLFWISSLDNEVRGHFLKYRVSTDYEDDGPPNWSWQDSLIAFPKELERTYVEAVDRMLAEGKIPKRDIPEFKRKQELAGEKLWHRIGWMPRQPPIMLNEKRMMLGLYSDVWDCSLMAFTEDAGASWEFSKPMLLSSFLNVQPALVRKRDGGIVAFMRDEPRVRRAESNDGGMNWDEDPLDLPCPGSSVAAIGLQSGAWLLATNGADGRHTLKLYLSDDEGRTWKWSRNLETFEKRQGSGQYPTLIQAANGDIHIVYTHDNVAGFGSRMRTIKHARFNEAWVKAAP